MGSQFQILSLKGDLNVEQVKGKFAAAQDEDRYENGHSYSGGFGMARGLEFPERPPFATQDAAETWLDENCLKWEAAKAVRYLDSDGVEQWVIGALCAS